MSKRDVLAGIEKDLADENISPETRAKLAESYSRMTGNHWKKRVKKPRGGQSTRFKTTEQAEIDALLIDINPSVAAEVRRLAYHHSDRGKQVFWANVYLLEETRKRERRDRAAQEPAQQRDPNASPVPSYSLVELQEIESQRRQAENDARLAEEKATYPKRLEYR